MATTAIDLEQTSAPQRGRPRVLCVDDEPFVLEGIRDTLRRSFDVRIATSGRDGLELLRADPDGYAVVISDMRMPAMQGSEFLREARRIAPDAVRMLLTGHADLDAAIRAVNEAQLFRFLTKPCSPDELMRACAAALGQHRLQTSERVLLEQTLRRSLDALVEVLALANPAAFGRAGRIKTLAGSLAAALELENRWEVEVAAMLAHVGAVTLPQGTAEKLYAGEQLSDQEAAMVRRIPAISRSLIEKIPRLEGILEILDSYQQPLASTEMTLGARVLRIAEDYDKLESQGVTSDVALGTMRGRSAYDTRLLDAFGSVVGVLGIGPAVREIPVLALRVGMTLADDVRATTGNLLVARGHRVTEQLLARLDNLTVVTVREPVRVFDYSAPQ